MFSGGAAAVSFDASFTLPSRFSPSESSHTYKGLRASERATCAQHKANKREKARDNLAPAPAFYFNKMYVCVTTF